MIKKSIVAILFVALTAVSFAACDKKEPVSSQSVSVSQEPVVSSTETSVTVSVETPVSEDVSDNTEEAVGISFEVSIINMCQADIGVVSVFNPGKGSQSDMGALPDGQVLNMAFNGWPEDVTDFDVAFYNNNGKLVSASTVDITGVKSSVTIILTGEGNIESVSSEVN